MARSLRCGGDPFAPSCVLACSDTSEPALGDRVDADRDPRTGCECSVRSLDDQVDPNRSGESIDDNCDGADGDVRQSYYVAADGDDSGPGSYTRPFRNIAHAVTLAAASLSGDNPRPHVFVASGTYTEIVEVPGGVMLAGQVSLNRLRTTPGSHAGMTLGAPASNSARFCGT